MNIKGSCKINSESTEILISNYAGTCNDLNDATFWTLKDECISEGFGCLESDDENFSLLNRSAWSSEIFKIELGDNLTSAFINHTSRVNLIMNKNIFKGEKNTNDAQSNGFILIDSSLIFFFSLIFFTTLFF